jgi:hypothetical protein
MPSPNKLTRNTEELNACQPIYQISQKEEPTAVGNRLELFKSNTAARRPTANERTFDLFPNMIPLTTEIMLTSLEYATSIGADLSAHPKLSVATICFYQLFVLYGYFLVNDCYVRPSSSNFAKSWLQSTSRTKLLRFITRLPVPSWMIPVLDQFSATSSPTNGNVFIVPSAASVRPETHYGRFFPVNFFSAIHDIAATMPGNSPVNDVYIRLLFTELSRFMVQGEPAEHMFVCCIMDLLGITLDTDRNNLSYINSRLYQAFDSIFNPVLFRDAQRRKTFAKTSIMPTEFDSSNDFNIYDLLFAFNEQNDAEIYVILETVATALDTPAGFSKSLGQTIAGRSSKYAFDHGYSEFLLPTWSSNPIKPENKTKGPTDPKKFNLDLVSNKKRAEQLTFLQGTPPPAATLNTDHRILVNIRAHNGTQLDDKSEDSWQWPDATKPILKAILHPYPFPRPLFLGPYSTSEEGKTELDDYIKFSEPRHVAPEYQILDTSSDAEETAWLTGLSGKIIESFEIDGSTVAHPDPTQSTANQNHQQGESLVPVRYTISPLEFYAERALPLVAPRNRTDNVSDDRVICSTHLLDRTRIEIPTPQQAIRDARVPTGFPGLTITENINWIERFQYFLGFRASDRYNHGNDSDAIPYMPKGRLYVFSPYMYTGFDDAKPSQFRATKLRAYWVTNLRTHFGSDTQLLDATHPYKAHPLL